MEEFEFNENAYFYKVINEESVESVIKDVLSNAIDDKKEGALYEKVFREPTGIEGMLSSFVAYKRKMRPACFPKDLVLEDKWWERKFAYLLILEYGGYIVVIKKNIPTIRALKGVIKPVDYNILCNVLVDDETVFKKFGIDNLDMSDFAMRSKVLESENLESVFSTIGANNFFLDSLRLRNSEGTFSLAMNQSKINQYSNKKAGFDAFVEWVKKIVDMIAACDGGSVQNYLSVFATPVDYQKEYREGNLEARAVLISLYKLYNEDVEHIKRQYKDGEEDKEDNLSVDELCSRFQYAFDLTDDGDHNYSAPVDDWGNINVMMVSERGVSIHGDWMKNVIISKNIDGDEICFSLFDYIRENGLYTVMFDSPILKYSNRTLFKDHRLTGNIDTFLDLFEDDLELAGIADEKVVGHFNPDDMQFAYNTLFGYIERHYRDDEKIMVCDDLGTEWADHIQIGDNSVSLFAAKHKDLCFSASAFQEVVGQAQKNLGIFFPQESQWDRKIEKWNDVYKLGRVTTHIQRVRTNGKTSCEAVDMWKKAERNLNFKKDVYLVIDFISKGTLRTNLINLRDGIPFGEKKETIPMLWLLSSLYASCQELHIGLHITCRP